MAYLKPSDSNPSSLYSSDSLKPPPPQKEKKIKIQKKENSREREREMASSGIRSFYRQQKKAAGVGSKKGSAKPAVRSNQTTPIPISSLNPQGKKVLYLLRIRVSLSLDFWSPDALQRRRRRRLRRRDSVSSIWTWGTGRASGWRGWSGGTGRRPWVSTRRLTWRPSSSALATGRAPASACGRGEFRVS